MFSWYFRSLFLQMTAGEKRLKKKMFRIFALKVIFFILLFGGKNQHALLSMAVIKMDVFFSHRCYSSD